MIGTLYMEVTTASGKTIKEFKIDGKVSKDKFERAGTKFDLIRTKEEQIGAKLPYVYAPKKKKVKKDD